MKIRLCQKLIKDFQLVQPSLKSVKEKRLRVFPASLELSVGSELKCWKLSFWHIQSSYLEIFYSTSPTFEILRFHYLNLSISIYLPKFLMFPFCWRKSWAGKSFGHKYACKQLYPIPSNSLTVGRSSLHHLRARHCLPHLPCSQTMCAELLRNFYHLQTDQVCPMRASPL